MAGNALALMAIQSVVNIRKQEALQLLAAGYGCTELVSQLAENGVLTDATSQCGWA
jgi:hypothetical protein